MDVESYYRYLTAIQLSKGDTYVGKCLENRIYSLISRTQMLDKQDETISTMREESQKTRDTVREESQKTRDDLKGLLERGFDV